MASSINADNGVSSGSAGLKSTADSSGVLALQTNGTTAISIDASQAVSFTNQPTYSGGTANGVAYLNGSKVLTTGSALVFDGSNLGLGVTPSASGSASAKILQVNSAAGLYGYVSGTTIITGLANNVYGFGGIQYYLNTGANATSYVQSQFGQHQWFNAPSGTAGNAITFTQAMTLDASGNLLVGTTAINRLGSGATGAAFQLATSTGAEVYLSTSDTASGAFVGAINFGTTGTSSATKRSALIGSVLTAASGTNVSGNLIFYTNNAGILDERMRIDSSGNLLVGDTSAAGFKFLVNNGSGTNGSSIARLGGTGGRVHAFYYTNGTDGNAAACSYLLNKDASTSRSINAGGTVNANGADYAEYMTKAGNFTVAKGDVVGINAEGKLTNVFVDAVSFVVKSTDPSYVGNDSWGTKESLGLTKPEEDAPQEEKDIFHDALETARQKVDRIAFAGQVPVNVMGATAGQYIIPVNDNGAIKGEAVNEADMTLSQYMKAVGKVIAIESDGRAKIIVKVA